MRTRHGNDEMTLRGLFCVLGLLVGQFATTAYAQQAPCSDPMLDMSVLEARADGLFRALMQAEHIPGATVAIVQCSEIRILKGYGFENVASGTVVNPERTLFRIGSVSKTLTFTALMQLVEQGKVNPDKPVNSYLRTLDLPSFEGREVLIRDLFAHRPGFEDRAAGILFRHGSQGMITTDEWLRTTRPELVREPGKRVVYSNYGATLAGMVVEQVSGKPFHEYVARHILAPLDMNSTSFKEPDLPIAFPSLAPELADRISTGYFYRNGVFEPQPFTHIWHVAPAGSASATSADMARFMLEVLEGQSLLARETWARMQTRPYDENPAAPGYAWGFRTSWIKGFPTFEHNGSAYTHFSAMVMVPDREIGVFVSVNGSDDHQAPYKLAVALIEGMIAGSQPVPGWYEPEALSPEASKMHEGTYLIDRRSYTRLAKFFAPIIGVRKVARTGEGALRIEGGAETGLYRQVAPGVFHDPSTGNIVRFGYDGIGRANYMSANYGHYGFDRVSWWQTATPLVALLSLVTCLALLQLAWHRPRQLALRVERRPPGIAERLMTAKALVSLAMAGAFVATALQLAQMGEGIAFIWPTPALAVTLAIQWVWLAIVVITAWCILRMVFRQDTPKSAAFWPAIVFTIDILLIGQLWQWNLLSLNLT